MPLTDTANRKHDSSPGVKLKKMLESLPSRQLQKAIRELPENQLKQALSEVKLASLNSKSAKIRLLARSGYSTSHISDLLGISYQHAYNVIKAGENTPYVETDTNGHPDTRLSSEKVTIGAAGRIVIPADIRERLGVKEGDELILHFKDGELVIHSRKTALAKARALVRKYVPEGESLADELIAERRAEAAKEGA